MRCPHCGKEIRNAKRVSTTETREQAATVIEHWNDVMRGHLSVTKNIPFVERALFAGYDSGDLMACIGAVRYQSTPTAKWLFGDGRKYRDLYHLTRPPYNDSKGNLRPGLLHKILEELDSKTGPDAPKRLISEEEI